MEENLSRPSASVRAAAVAATTISGALGLVPWWVVCGSPVVTIVGTVVLVGVAMLYQKRVPARARRPKGGGVLAAILAAWFALSVASFVLLVVFGLGFGAFRITEFGLRFFSKTISFSGWQSGFWSSLLVAVCFVPAITALSARDVNRILFPDSLTSNLSWRFLRQAVPKGVALVSVIGFLLIAWLLPRLLLNDEAGLLDGFLTTLAFLLASSPGPAIVDAIHQDVRASANAPSNSEMDFEVPAEVAAGERFTPHAVKRVSVLFERAGFEIAPVESESRLTQRLDFVASRDSLVVPVEVATTVDAHSFDTALASSALATASRVWAASSGAAASQPMLVVVAEGHQLPTMKLGAVTVVGIDADVMESALALGADGSRAATDLLHLSMARETS